MVSISTYAPVRQCIYCGGKGEGDEHIVAFSLGGLSILPKASCHECEAITCGFEQRCARSWYGAFRVTQNVQTRNPKQRPKFWKAQAVYEDRSEPLELPISAMLATLPTIRMLPPGHLRNPAVREKGWTGATLSVRLKGPNDLAAWANTPSTSIAFTQEFDADALARTYAKTAHALCIGTFGQDFFEPWLPPYILGKDPHLSYLIGGAPHSDAPEQVLHNLTYWAGKHENGEWLVLTDIRFFAQAGGPHARVIVGRTTEEKVLARLAQDSANA
jgi:hypothetical protein